MSFLKLPSIQLHLGNFPKDSFLITLMLFSSTALPHICASSWYWCKLPDYFFFTFTWQKFCFFFLYPATILTWALVPDFDCFSCHVVLYVSQCRLSDFQLYFPLLIIIFFRFIFLTTYLFGSPHCTLLWGKVYNTLTVHSISSHLSYIMLWNTFLSYAVISTMPLTLESPLP